MPILEGFINSGWYDAATERQNIMHYLDAVFPEVLPVLDAARGRRGCPPPRPASGGQCHRQRVGRNGIASSRALESTVLTAPGPVDHSGGRSPARGCADGS